MIGDATYELVKKRTFLTMSIIIGLYSLVLVMILIITIKKKDEDCDKEDDEGIKADEEKKLLTN